MKITVFWVEAVFIGN